MNYYVKLRTRNALDERCTQIEEISVDLRDALNILDCWELQDWFQDTQFEGWLKQKLVEHSFNSRASSSNTLPVSSPVSLHYGTRVVWNLFKAQEFETDVNVVIHQDAIEHADETKVHVTFGPLLHKPEPAKSTAKSKRKKLRSSS